MIVYRIRKRNEENNHLCVTKKKRWINEIESKVNTKQEDKRTEKEKRFG